MTLDAQIGSKSVDEVLDAVLRWELPDPEAEASWEWESNSRTGAAITSGIRPRWLNFQMGTLRWNEEIRSYRDELEIRFVLTDGDFSNFSGKWKLRQESDGVALRFEAEFDFGVLSMAGFLDPIAIEAIRDTIGRAISGMFPDAILCGGVTELTDSVSPVVSRDEYCEIG
ncbi:SRPBCC family protein [Streptomyces sp. NPDC005065]|uniref:SRPBCC family protein n=1 Tax=unclassified Streptomyces TaxID=2593676 RepID=UPI0033B61C25